MKNSSPFDIRLPEFTPKAAAMPNYRPPYDMLGGGVGLPPPKDKDSIELTIESQSQLSPRSKYIDSCIRTQINPRASLILRKTFSKRLSLKHQGIVHISFIPSYLYPT